MRRIRTGNDGFRRLGRAPWIALTVIAASAALLVGAVGKSSATTIPNFTSPVHLNETFQGCRNSGTITLPNGSGQFICPDAAYTSGNLGKGWNELDLVPFRLTLSLGTQSTATTDYNLIVAGDNTLGGKTGYDVISAPTVNSSSDASCSVSSTPFATGAVGVGGVDTSIYEVWTVHQAKGSTCTFDYYMRLALGSHLYSGSSLGAQSFDQANFSGGQSTISIPVNEIVAQSLTKDMAATTSATQAWNIAKSPSPASIHYGDICSKSFSPTQPLAVTVTWSKAAVTPSGQVHLITHVYATNPSSRTVTVTPTDKMYEGSTTTTQVGVTDTGAAVDIPANTTQLVLTDDQTVSSSASSFNDVATATYTDKVTGVPVPGSTQATASANVSTTTFGQFATATDSESIAGTGLTFAVATPSFGAFTGGYTAGTYTTGPVGWSSGTNTISSNGSVVFNKTIKLDPAQVTTGSITDTAHITPSDGGSTVDSAPLTVSIDSSATSTLTINKNVSQKVSSDQTFHFDLKDASNNVVQSNIPVTVTAGTTSGSAQVTGLTPGNYTVVEDTPPAGWSGSAPQSVDLTGCSNSVTFTDQLAPAVAFANKVTDPSGNEQGWTFTLTRPDSSTLTGTTNSSGQIIWTGGSATAPLGAEGTYTISETQQSGWSEVGAAQATGSTGVVTGGTGAGAHCSFTVAYPLDADLSYGCTITNQSRGQITVIKHTLPAGSSQSFSFATTGSGYTSGFSLTGQTGHNTNIQTVASPGTYTVNEGSVSGWTLDNVSCSSDSGALGGSTFDTGTSASPNATIHLAPGDNVTCVFENTQAASLIVKKVTVPAGSTTMFTFDPTGFNGGSSFQLNGASGTNTSEYDGLTPGSGYAVAEASKTGWDLTGSSCDNGNDPSAITLAPGSTVTCTFTNTQRANLIVKKVTVPAGSAQLFTFDPTGFNGGSSFQLNGQSGTNTSEYDNLAPGSGYAVAEETQSGWDLTGSSCDNGNDPSAITLAPGSTVTCTFTNTQRGSITVKKLTDPSPDPSNSSFSFTGDVSGSIGNDQTLTTDNLQPGTYTSTEGSLTGTGWTLQSISCDDGSSLTPSTGNVGTQTATFKLDPGEHVTCTFTNRSRGQITVVKQTDPAGSTQSFSFTTSGSGYTGFSLTGQSGSNTNVQTVAPGTYTVNEGSVSHWALDNLSCSSDTGALGGSTFDAGTSESPNATIHLAPGDHVTCTFHNTQKANLIVKKVTVPAGSTQNFNFDPTGFNAGNSFSLNGTTGTNQQSFTDLTPGSGYAVSEEATTGWDLTSSSCDNGNSPSAITLAAGTTVTCTFTNTQRGHIIVKKVTDPTGMTKQFTFTPSYNGGATFQLSDGHQNDSGAIVPGTYNVAETPAGGNWTLKSAICDGTGNTPSSIHLQAGQTITCTFTNQLRGNVQVIKTLNGQPLTSGQVFQFELRLGSQKTQTSGALQTLMTGSGTNPGTLNFTYPLVPGVTYSICELLQAGYGPNVPNEYGPYNPGDGSNYICWDFALTEAQANTTPVSFTFNVDNSHATAKGLTIGFWKNHADPLCKKSNGKQTDVLGQYLDGIILGVVTFRDPFVTGPGNFDECAAVQTLSKNTFSGKGMSSDPLFSMAAQLLAADLNVNTGDTPSSTAQTAINQAQALLVKYGWNGNSYSPKLTAADAALANSLNTILDKFNNNQI